MSLWIGKIWIALTLLSFSAFAAEEPFAIENHEADECAEALSNGGLTFAKIFARWDADYARGGRGLTRKRSEEVYKRFWRNTWPELRGLAADNGVSVAEMLKDVIALMEIVEETRGRGDFFKTAMAIVQKDLGFLENLNEGTKLKPRHWETVRHVYIMFSDFGHRAILLEQARRPFPSFDPYQEVTPAQVELILDSLESVALDDIVALSGREEQGREPEDEKSEENQAAIEISAEPVPLTAEHQLGIVLKEQRPLLPNFTYSARTPHGRDLRVTLSETLVEQALGSENKNIRRLLRSILVGRGDSSGIKMLASLGHGIVELKARIRGHKRIFGCLEGDHLQLKELMVIPASIGAYSTRISTNYCD